ncbi:MAG TPA: MarR family winged helix-turn-helix transcriptional regulator [Caulobacteraceae bacterium]
MTYSQSNSARAVRPRLGRGEEGGPLSRQLAHIGLQQLVRLIRLSSGLLYSRASGLSDFEWRVLARACDMPGLSINELGTVLRRGGPQVSRTVKRLVTMGLLRRENVGGGPGVAVSPTKQGEEAYAPLVALAIEGERELTEGLTEHELRVLDRVIAVMTENALARLAREQDISATRPAHRVC